MSSAWGRTRLDVCMLRTNLLAAKTTHRSTCHRATLRMMSSVSTSGLRQPRERLPTLARAVAGSTCQLSTLPSAMPPRRAAGGARAPGGPCTFQTMVGRPDVATLRWRTVAARSDGSGTAYSDAAPAPTPRFAGTARAVAAVLALPGPADSSVAVTDAIVGLACSLEGPAAQAALQRAREDGDAELVALLTASERLGCAALRRVEYQPERWPGRLNFGGHTAEQRLAAVRDGRFCIYPCPCADSADAWEVRFTTSGAGGHALTFERFLDTGKQEIAAYARRAAALGAADALQPLALSRNDPCTFWAAVWRYRTSFDALAEHSGDAAWRNELREGAHKATSAAAAALWTWTDLEAQIIAAPASRERLARRGVVKTLELLMHCVPGSSALKLEVGEGDVTTERIIDAVTESKRLMKSGMDAEKALKVALGDFDRQLADDDAELPPGRGTPAAGELAGLAGMSANLIGNQALCGSCRAKEAHKGLFKSCGGCLQIKYCNAACAKKHWLSGHKQACGKADSRPTPESVAAMVFPGDKDVKPYQIWLPSGEKEAAIAHIATLVGCAFPGEVTLSQVVRGEPHEVADLVLLHRKQRSGEANSRACTLLTLRERGYVDIGVSNPSVLVRGDAILLRRRGTLQEQANGLLRFVTPQGAVELADYTFAHFDAQFGIHGAVEIDKNTKALAWVLPNTADGLAMQMEMMKMFSDARAGRMPTAPASWQ